jgi:hypothetical protein
MKNKQIKDTKRKGVKGRKEDRNKEKGEEERKRNY